MIMPKELSALTENQLAFLRQLAACHALPVAQFIVKSSREDDFASVALAPVFLRSAVDGMSTVREAGAFLTDLEERGLLTVDYDIPLGGYDYSEYHASHLYAYFCETVKSAAGTPRFLGDTPCLELGSIALTELGENALKTVS